MPAKIFILKFGRCDWSKCLFCGYGALPGAKPDVFDIKKEFDSFFKALEPDVDQVKIFGSGSFLDEKQIPSEARKYLAEKCRHAGIKKLTVESRPEFIKKEVLDDFGGLELEVAVGLEVADDDALDRINKGFHLKDFEAAAEKVHAYGAKVRTYLLANPPFTSDVEKSLKDSVEYALQFSDSLVLINLLPHYAAKLMDLWVKGEWRFLSRKEFLKLTEKWAKDPRIDVDEETFKFIPKFPERLKENLAGVGEEFLTHPHFDVWQDYLNRWYQAPPGKKSIIFLPCSYKKPYSESSTHRGIIGVLEKLGLRGKLHEVMLSNAGVIPREFENMYPFNSYDWDEKNETEEVKRRYIEVTSNRIGNYLAAHEYERILCFLKYDSESYIALEAACSRAGQELLNLLGKKTYELIKKEKKPLQSEEALADLERGLKDEIDEI